MSADVTLGSRISIREMMGFAGSMFVIGSAFLSLSPLLPHLERDLSISIEVLGLPGGAYSLALGVTAFVSASFQDRAPRQFFILAGISIHIVGLLLVAQAGSLVALIVGFTACGIGAGILQPAIYALVSDLTSKESRGKTIGRVNFGWAACTLVGVPIAAGIASIFGWRIVTASWAVAWIAVVLALRGQLFCRGLKDSVQVRKSGTAAIESSFGDLRKLSTLFIATILIFVGFYGEYTFLGAAMAEASVLRLPATSILIFSYGAGFLIGTMNSSRIDRFGPQTTLYMVLPALALILLISPRLVDQPFLMVGAMTLWGLLQALTFTSITTIAGGFAPAVRGRALAYNSACVMIGASIGASIAGPVFARFGYGMIGTISFSLTLVALATLRLGAGRGIGKLSGNKA